MAITDARKLSQFDPNQHKGCIFCGKEEVSIGHTTWECTHLTLLAARHNCEPNSLLEVGAHQGTVQGGPEHIPTYGSEDEQSEQDDSPFQEEEEEEPADKTKAQK